MKRAGTLLLVCTLAAGLLWPPVVWAMGEMEKETGIGCWLKPENPGDTGLAKLPADIPSLGCLAQIITNVIELAFMFLGAVAVLMLLWGAVKYIISRGDQKALQQAQQTITYAVIGLVVVLGAYIIITIVTTTLGLPNILQNFRIYQP